MYNYSIVYVLVDDNTLKHYNVLMKSILSLRLNMKDILINVLVDKKTLEYLSEAKVELFDCAKVVVVDIPEGYNQVEKSRYLKTNARKLVAGDFLYIDSDTVVCRPFPHVISEKSFAIAFDQNAPFELLQTPYQYKVNAIVGILDVSKLKYYFNGGIMWVKDDKFAYDFFSQWFELWQKTKRKNAPFDQPSLNYILQKYVDVSNFGILENEWNVQVAGSCNSAIGYLQNAYIIHYFNIRDCAFLLCQSEYFNLPYNDEKIIKIIHNPLSSFGVGKLVRFNRERQAEEQIRKKIENTYQYILLRKIFKNGMLFAINERILAFAVSTINFFRRLVRKSL